MIVVKHLDEFKTFIEIAKNQNLPYSILGSERTGFEGMYDSRGTREDNKFYYTYALLCSSFTVYICSKVNIDERNTITDISATFDFIPFKHLTVKDGVLECNN